MTDNVRVAVRVRPFNSREKDRNATLIIKMQGHSTYINDPADSKAEPKHFSFDHSYWSHDGYNELPDGYLQPDAPYYADQRKVFQDLGEGVLSNAWKGYNCSLFAYGQTGSGKSYSIVGYGSNKGIVPVTCERLFEGINKKKADGSATEYMVTLSMLEIYNEQARDLLNPATLKIKGGMKVRQHPKTGFYVDGLTTTPVGSYKDIDAKIDQGTKNRTIASTNMNATSSRAHTIVSIGFSQKGQNEETGQNTTKTSIINLVDLAGSERADSTGATGDRLKEGSAINQSLSTLGNVIKALADQSLGKGKVVIPFRDSVLTMLLKNALGGNSKTIMIAALSPADINFEETLSTLRFADRAKSIKTKAIVNESPTDKLIRELREENERLQKALQAAAGNPAALAALLDGNPSVEPTKSAIDEQEFELMKKEMEEQLARRAQEMEEMKISWEERLKEQEIKSQVEVALLNQENQMKKTTAHLWNLNEDPQLSNMIAHFLKAGRNRIGTNKASPPADVILTGLSIQPEHAVVDHDELANRISIAPGSQAKLMVNGVSLVEERELRHGDRIMFGSNLLFVLHHPKDPDLVKKQDEARNAGKILEEELPTFDKAQEEIAQNSGLVNYGSLTDRKDGAKSPEDVLLQEDLLRILPMINEANAMSEEMDKKVMFDLALISPQARGEAAGGRTEVMVKMLDLTNGNEFLWEKNKFINRKYIMLEHYQSFVDGDPHWQVPKEKDPFWEAADTDVLIGRVHLYLSSITYKIEVVETLGITDYKGVELGGLEVQVIPCDQNGMPTDDDDFVEDPNELVGTALNFKVRISGAKGLPKRFSKGESYCKYQLYLEKDPVITNRVHETTNPDYQYEKLHTFSPVTRQLVDYLLTTPLIVEVWGKQSGETKTGAEGPSTRQLVNQVAAVRGSSRLDVTVADEDDRYRLLCDVNTYKRRAERWEKKFKRLHEALEKYKKEEKSTMEIETIEKILQGPDRSNLHRFMAAADIVLQGEKMKHNPRSPNQSATCSLQ